MSKAIFVLASFAAAHATGYADGDIDDYDDDLFGVDDEAPGTCGPERWGNQGKLVRSFTVLLPAIHQPDPSLPFPSCMCRPSSSLYGRVHGPYRLHLGADVRGGAFRGQRRRGTVLNSNYFCFFMKFVWPSLNNRWLKAVLSLLPGAFRR